MAYHLNLRHLSNGHAGRFASSSRAIILLGQGLGQSLRVICEMIESEANVIFTRNAP